MRKIQPLSLFLLVRHSTFFLGHGKNILCVWNVAQSDDTISASRPGKGGCVVLFSFTFSNIDDQGIFPILSTFEPRFTLYN